MASKEIAVFGCGGHGISVLDIILQHDPEASLVFVDEMAKPDETITTRSPQREFKVVTEIEPTTDREYFVAIGNDLKRREVSRSLGDVTLTKIVAKNAQLGMDSEVGDGAFIGHQAIIGPMARVGKGVIINTRSHISHEVEVGDYSQLTFS
jgi:UDP-N-acetylbacillosamine N-acetyltransferase